MPELVADIVIAYNSISSLYDEDAFQPEFDGDIVDLICYFAGDIKQMKWYVPVDNCLYYHKKWHYNEKNAFVYGGGDNFTVWKCPAYEKLINMATVV